MDVWQVLAIGFRRWKITLPIAILGVLLAWTYSSGVEPTYSADASLLYLPSAVSIFEVEDPAVAADEEGEIVEVLNPFGASLRSAALAGELYINSDVVRDDISDLGLSSNYGVTTDRRNAVLYFVAEAKSPDVAVATIDELLVVAEDDLKGRQDAFGVDEREQVTVQVVTKDQSAAADFGARVRIRAILLLLALAFAFGVGVLLEGFLDHRAGRRPFHVGDDDELNAGGGTLTIQIPDSLVREMGRGTLTPLPPRADDDGGIVEEISSTTGRDAGPRSASSDRRSSRWGRDERSVADGA